MDSPCIPAIPDISGIGVRTAIYTQNLLCFLPVIIYLKDGKVTVDELAGLQDQSIGMLAIAFAILLTTVTLAIGSRPSVSNYHAYIVLSLSWMNNTSTWIWFILHVYAQSTAKYKPVDATWKAWLKIIWGSVTDLDLGAAPSPKKTPTPAAQQPGSDVSEFERGNSGNEWIPLGPMGKGKQRAAGGKRREDVGGKGKGKEVEGKDGQLKRPFAAVEDFWLSKCMRYPRFIFRFIFHCLFGAPVLSLGSVHLSLMAGIGIRLWSNPSAFGKPLGSCTPILTIFGASSSFSSRPLRIFSLTMYSVLLIPGLNLLPPFAFFLFLHISYTRVRRVYARRRFLRQKREPTDREGGVTENDNKSSADTSKTPWSKTAFLLVGLLSLFLVNILFVVDTELTLQRNEAYQGSGESEWGFGQILALLLLAVPLRDAWIALRNIQNNLQQRFEQAFDTVCEVERARDELDTSLGDGANPWRKISGRFGYHLHQAAYFGNLDLVKLLLRTTLVHINDVGGDYGTALQAAAARGHAAVVEHLVQAHADPNIPGGDYGTALCAACVNGNLDTVKNLLAAGSIRKDQGSEFGLPLHIAVLLGKVGIVKALVENQAQAVDGEWLNTTMKALDVAYLAEEEEITTILENAKLTFGEEDRRLLRHLQERQGFFDVVWEELEGARTRLKLLVERDKIDMRDERNETAE